MTTLPKEWKSARLGDVCLETRQWNPGKEPRTAFHYIDVSAVSNELFRVETPTWVKAAEAPGRARKIVQARDVIFATIRPTLRRVALIPARYDDQVVSTAFCVVRADPAMAVPEFLYYLMLSDQANAKIAEKQHGASYPAVRDKDIFNLQIPLPPLPEQHRIAAVLSRIQRAIELQDALVARARELKKSLLKFVFTRGLRGEKTKETKIGRIPASWSITAVSERYDFTKAGGNRFKSNDLVPFLPMDLIPEAGIALKTWQMRKAGEIQSRTYFEKGDLLLARITPCFENGKQVLTDNLPSGSGLATTEVIPIRGRPDESDTRYLFYYLLCPEVRTLIAGKMEGATGRQRVPSHVVKDLLLPMPPTVQEQKEVAHVFAAIDRKIAIHEAKKLQLQDLFKTALNRMMIADLRAKDNRPGPDRLEVRP